jgi:hypothetical protein
VVDSLKVLDPKWPIREADIVGHRGHVRKVPQADMAHLIGLRGHEDLVN